MEAEARRQSRAEVAGEVLKGRASALEDITLFDGRRFGPDERGSLT